MAPEFYATMEQTKNDKFAKRRIFNYCTLPQILTEKQCGSDLTIYNTLLYAIFIKIAFF